MITSDEQMWAHRVTPKAVQEAMEWRKRRDKIPGRNIFDWDFNIRAHGYLGQIQIVDFLRMQGAPVEHIGEKPDEYDKADFLFHGKYLFDNKNQTRRYPPALEHSVLVNAKQSEREKPHLTGYTFTWYVPEEQLMWVVGWTFCEILDRDGEKREATFKSGKKVADPVVTFPIRRLLPIDELVVEGANLDRIYRTYGPGFLK